MFSLSEYGERGVGRTVSVCPVHILRLVDSLLRCMEVKVDEGHADEKLTLERKESVVRSKSRHLAAG